MANSLVGNGIPSIRTFQFDSSSIGQISSAVNLFRGDVNIPQPLFTLPSRNTGGGLDINFSVFYQSNVFQTAALRNLESPTSALGLGWDLPLSYIEASNTGSPDPDTRLYTLNLNGRSNTLVRQPEQPFLFKIAATLANMLQPGQPVTFDVCSQFLQSGLPLDSGAVVSGSAGNWTITDDALEQCFIIQTSASDQTLCNVCYGGRAFQLQDYSFWHIVYFPAYERWLVVTDDGIRKSFGGGVTQTPQGYATSSGSSIAWEVWWTLNGIPAWTGPSSLTAGQTQVACAWYLASDSDPFGDSIAYEYNGWARNGNGLIPEVEQQVGSDGQPYTKAVYLTKITDVFGRTVVLNYCDKVWSDNADNSPREYADPHRATPSNAPNGYQDCYETKYLDNIVVSASNGTALNTVLFGYLPRPDVQGPEGAVANVNASYSGALVGDTFKRYLTSIVIENGQGASLPGFLYDYYLGPYRTGQVPEGAQPGALQMLTFPQGGQAGYSYQVQQLTQCDREQTINRPAQTPNGSPAVFYGDNYVVTLWFDPTVPAITLQVWSWYGRWVCWQPDSGPVVVSGAFDSETINVFATAQFFALTFDGGSDSVAYVFNKAIGSPGQFTPAVLNGHSTVPTVTFTGAAGIATYMGGDNFFAASLMNPETGVWQYDIFSYSWVSQDWSQQSFQPANLSYLAAAGEYLFVVDAMGTATLQYRDAALNWHTSATLTIPSPGQNTEEVALTAGPAFVALNLQSGTPPYQTYQIVIAQWDANHNLSLGFNGTFNAYQSDQAPLLMPTIVSNSLVALGPILLRYSGGTWISNGNLALTPPAGASPLQQYAYAADYALQVVMNQGTCTAAVLGYDPNADATSWATQPATSDLPPLLNPYDNFPSATDDFAVVGPTIYYRGVLTDWTQIFANPQQAIANIASLASGFDSQSLVNEGPNFFSYAVSPDNEQASVQSIVLQNAQVLGGTSVPFSSEKIYTPSLEQDTGPGISPQGPGLFVTYPATNATFESASAINLHYYAGAAVAGPLTHFPIYQLSVKDQYQDPSVTTYVPDPAQAACDPSGLVIKYYQTTVYPGSDPNTAAHGKTVNTYLNGLNVESDNYFDMLDGMLLETAIYDSSGTLVQSKSNTWVVLNEVASDPADAAAPLLQLFGGWVACNQQVSVADGVTTSRSIGFSPPELSAPYTGRPAEIVSHSYNGAGAAETWTKTFRYGVEVNPSLCALNMRSAAAQTIITQQLSTAGAVTVQSSASAFTMWPSSAAAGALAPAQEGSFLLVGATTPAFPYDTYTAGSSPDGWLLKQRVLLRTVRGQVADQVDGCGTATSILYSADLTFSVAKFTNASAGSAAYLGFEPYEDTSDWTLTGTVPETNDVRTGTTSVTLPGGASAQLSVAIRPNISAQNYVVGFWYKTSAGFQPATGAGCTVTCGGKNYFSQFTDSKSEWALATIGIPITKDPSSLQVVIANSSDDDVLLDSVHVVPLPGSMLARSYDAESQNYTTVMDAAGRTRWSYYDPFQRPSIQVGPNGCPKEVAMRFSSRQGSSSDSFQASSPNAELTLHAAGGGAMETFLDSSGWQQNWQPDDAANWQACQGFLANVSNAPATLICAAELPPTWSVYFETTFPSGSSSVSIAAGDVSVGWSESAYSCTAGGQPLTALANPPAMAQHWLLVAGDGVVLFFANGQLIFSRAGSFGLGSPKLTVSAGLGLTHLALLAAPRLGLSYNDGSGRQRQVHQLYAADCRVSEKIYDALDRLVATTRVAPGSFGSGASYAPLQYRPSFVDVSGFLTNFFSTGAMGGDVAEYYQGQSENGISRSNDDGYPYHGTLWESSPRRRKIELGLPGKPYAIANLGSTTPAQRATTQFSYGANTGQDPTLPAGQYNQTNASTPTKSNAISLRDQRGQGVATSQIDTGGATTSASGALRTFTQTDTGPQASLTMNMPNALLSGPQSDPAAFVRTTISDAAGRAITAFDPNAGQTQFLYDPCGRIRFVQPALSTGEQWFFYNKYDALGRVLEQGTIPQPWNAEALAADAADMSWPGDGVERTITYLWTYDGDGNTAAQIGQKTSCVTTTAGSPKACITTETFSYDRAGMLSGVAMSLSGCVVVTAECTYSYNNLGEMLVLTQPSGSPIGQVVYAINDQGWITSIGTSSDQPASLAAYTYTVEGAVETESLGGYWNRSTQYLSPGWIQQVATASSDGKQSLTMAYTYNADSTVAGRNIAYSFAALSGPLADTYSYDGQGRLASASGSSDETITSYDPNSNIWEANQQGSVQSFPAAPGTDQVAETTIAGLTDPVTYDARGRLTGATDRTLNYDDASNLTISGSAGNNAVQLGYGGHGQRVLKVVTGESPAQCIYFSGASQLPIALLNNQTWSALVHGPTGLIAVVSDDTYYPLKDHQQSVLAVVDGSGLVARYVYLPFGATTADGPNPNVLAYRFMGQEWDAELSLYNFRDRMYDPLLRRFLTPDPARQFPSPYLFCGSNPINAIDPTGDLSLWARIGIGLGVGAVLIVGTVLSAVTLGAAAPAAAAADAAALGAAAGAEAAAGAAAAGGAEGVAAAAVEGGAEAAAGAAAEGGAAGASEVGAGAAAGAGEAAAGAAPTAAAQSAWMTAANIGIQVSAGTLQGGAASGLQYDIQHGRDFTAAGFFESVGWGAAGGALGAGLAQGPLVGFEGAINALSPLAKFGATIGINGVAGAASSGLTNVLSNVAAHEPWYKGLLEATAIGFGESAVLSGISAGLGHAEPLSPKVSDESIQNLNANVRSMVDSVQAAARSENAPAVYITASFFAVAALVTGGAVAWSQSQRA